MAFRTKFELMNWFDYSGYEWSDFEIVVFEEKAKKKGKA
jgi:hypothetical protein